MEPQTYKTALRELVDRPFLGSVRYSAQQMRADRPRCHPDILAFEAALVRRLKAMGVPVFCHCAWRSEEAQEAHFKAGLSKARAGQSPHNHGLAVDIVHGTRAWNLSRKAWEVIGHVGKEVALQRGIKVTWGGDWQLYDPAHWELADWRSLTDRSTWEATAEAGLY